MTDKVFSRRLRLPASAVGGGRLARGGAYFSYGDTLTMRNPRPGLSPLIRSFVLAALGAAVVAAPLSAQEQQAAAPTGQTHTVKKGDTLWDIAKQYLNDPFLWPEIYRLNTDVVEDPHWIYPGEVLKIPGGGQMVAEDTMQAPAPAQTPAAEEAPRGQPGATVFAASLSRGVRNASRFGGSANLFPHGVVRPGEFYSAPWVDMLKGPVNQGFVLASAEIPGIGRFTEIRRRMLPQEEAYITLPKDVVASVGDHFLTFRHGDELADGQGVMIPTGVVEIEVSEAGEATLARVVNEFGYMQSGDGVIPIERFNLSPDARPSPLLLGTEAKVVWVQSNAILPTEQQLVILDATEKQGVKVGDQFTLYRPRTKVEAQIASAVVTVPERRIALVQVIKVSPYGTTAMIVAQEQPAIRVGTNARLTARMP